MSVFTPHIAISHQYHNLELPMGFQPDDIEILVKATPDERAVVINTGCVALQALIQKRNEICKGDAYKEGKKNGIKEESNKWQQEKKRIVSNNDEKVKELENELRTLREKMNGQKAAIAVAETRYATAEGEANAFRERELKKINDTRAEVESEVSHKLKTLTDELHTAKAAADKAASDLREAQQKFVQDMKKNSSEFRDEENKLRNQLSLELKEKSAHYETQLKEIKLAMQNEIDRQNKIIESISSHLESANTRLTEELKSAQAATEKASLDLLKSNQKAAEDVNRAKDEKFAEIRAAEQKVREELKQKIKDLQTRLDNLTHRQANSSLKGKDNEDAFAELLNISFGTSGDHYLKLPKTTEAGDHIIEWKQMKLMFENKKYKNPVPTEEVNKALKDFVKHPECDVLIFVSENSRIVNRKSHFDITSEDGRPAIWIGEFCRNEDKVVYLQLVGQVAEELIRLKKREKKFENDEEIVDYKKKVEDLIQSFKDTKDDLDNLLKLQDKCKIRQDNIWKELKYEMVSVIARFELRQKEASGNNDEDEEESKAKQPRKKASAKKKTSAAGNVIKSPGIGQQATKDDGDVIVLEENEEDVDKENDEPRTNVDVNHSMGHSIQTQQHTAFDDNGRNGAKEDDDSQPETKKSRPSTPINSSKKNKKKSPNNSLGSQNIMNNFFKKK